MIILISRECKKLDITEWRKGNYNIKKARRLHRDVQNLKHSSAKDPEKKAQKEKEITNAYQSLINFARECYNKASNTLAKLKKADSEKVKNLELIETYYDYVNKHIDLTERRVIKGEKIPHEEKVFSVFEPHTEWICKGKAGVPQELGLRVCILEDQYGFKLHHQVMQGLTDDKVTVSMVKNAKEKFPNLKGCSFDKGFYTPKNKEELEKELEIVVMSKKGKLSTEEREKEKTEEFRKYKNKHSAVESAISALDNQGLDMCPDKGIDGFGRYVAIGILARNLQVLGSIIQKKERKKQKKRKGIKLSQKKAA
jgi:transposase, IS5 family